MEVEHNVIEARAHATSFHTPLSNRPIFAEIEYNRDRRGIDWASPIFMNNILIREMQLEDIPTLADWIPSIPLWRRYGLTSTKLTKTLQDAYAGGDWLFVAQHEEAPACGCAWLMPRGAFGRSVYLRLLGVHPDYTGLSIGAKLLHQSQIAAFAYQSSMFLLVSDFNVDAQRFYEREGYQKIGEIPRFVLPTVTEYIYWKDTSLS